MNVEDRIKNYWDRRSDGFSRSRRLELDSDDAAAWSDFIQNKIPARSSLNVLDIGTGAGFFAILLSRLGHRVVGIDMSAAMIDRARNNAKDYDSRAEFCVMNAQSLEFDDETFDVVISRNLTWTLPDVPTAYHEWRRVLTHGGVLLNFDSDYGDKNFFDVTTCSKSNVSDEQLDECGAIRDSLTISRHRRPAWDVEYLRSIGFDVSIDEDIAPIVHRDNSLEFDKVPLFAITATKIDPQI